jgi:dTDP-4-dehydrorhamnose 3,5-epimerase
MNFLFNKVDIEGLIVIKPTIYYDDRGYFLETYKEIDFKNNGITTQFVQDNHSVSKYGVIRALHYQINPMAQDKLVRVIKGKALDVAVDLRKSSPTFLKWFGIILSEENQLSFYIPHGFAHGLAALSEEVYLTYKCSNEYSKEHERGIRFDDPRINIDWGLKNPIISEKDRLLPLLNEAILFE